LCCSCWQSRQVTTGDGANLLIRLDIFTGLSVMDTPTCGRMCHLLSIEVHFVLQVVAVAAYLGSRPRRYLAEVLPYEVGGVVKMRGCLLGESDDTKCSSGERAGLRGPLRLKNNPAATCLRSRSFHGTCCRRNARTTQCPGQATAQH